LSLAQFELRRIRETWQASKRHAVEKGIHIARHAPPGYSRGPDRRLQVDPERAEAVREAFSMAASGEAYARIADHLCEHGIMTTSNRVRRMLDNRAYLGEARNGHGDVNPEAHPPLVDAVTWNLAQRQRPNTPTLTRSTTHLLSGLVRCASCSFAMRPSRPSGNTVAVYRCTTVTAHGRCPGPSTISASRLEEYVIHEFLASAREETYEPVNTDDDDAAQSAERIVQAERSYRSALTDLDLRQQIGDADHAQLVAKLHGQWREALAAAPAPVARPPAGDLIDMEALVGRLRQDDNINALRELLGSAIQAVFVRPAASRQRNLPVADRVRVVFHGQELLELPRRGASYNPRTYEWDAA
jgi:hypothetical protein